MNPDRPGIDWDAVRRRIEASTAALDAALTASPERLEAVYRERAAALAGRRAQTAPVGRRVLVFELGAERYGLDFGDVTGVLPFDVCTPVPGGPPELLGVMNINGEIRSVLDLGALIGLPAGSERAGYVLLVRARGRATALRVDRLDRVRLVSPGEIATPEGDGRTDGRYVTGLTADAVRLLDTVAVLAHPVFHDSAADSERPAPDRGSPP
jgi:purine-binding chemotaxis protein CheW